MLGYKFVTVIVVVSLEKKKKELIFLCCVRRDQDNYVGKVNKVMNPQRTVCCKHLLTKV